MSAWFDIDRYCNAFGLNKYDLPTNHWAKASEDKEVFIIDHPYEALKCTTTNLIVIDDHGRKWMIARTWVKFKHEYKLPFVDCNCNADDDTPLCPVCEWGAQICKICGKAECDLEPECPVNHYRSYESVVLNNG